MQIDRRVALGLLVCGLFSLGLRTILVADEVFVNGEVRFHETDPYYHVRLIDHTVRHFPHRTSYDPFAVAPDGHVVPVAPLFDQAVAAVALLVTAGRPTDYATHVVAAWLPALLGALIVLPVYAIGRVCFSPSVGLVSAGLIAVAPGVFLDRTRLGYADHHVAESLLAALAVAALAYALDAAARSWPAPRAGPALGGRPVATVRSVVSRSLLFGLFLGLYVLSWIGGFLLVAVIAVWAVVQATSDHLRGRDVRRGAAVAVPGLLLALAMVLLGYGPLPLFHLQVAALVGALVAALALTALSLATNRTRYRRVLFVAAAAGGALLALGLVQVAAPEWLAAAAGMLRRFLAPGAGLEVAEVQPLLQRSGTEWFRAVILEFTTGAVLAVVGLVALVRAVARRGESHRTLLLVWSVAMLGATLVQVRFAYYSAVNVALLTALACRVLWRWAARPGGAPAPRGRTGDVLTAAALALVAFGPGLYQAPRVAGSYGGPDADWRNVLHWMRDETPSPFAEPDDFHESYERRDPGGTSGVPRARYAVMNWWDYGYWILQEARRVPAAIPTQAGARTAATFYLAQSEPAAGRILEELRIRYVLVDATLPLLNPRGMTLTAGKFPSLATWAGRRPETFYESYSYERSDGTVGERTLYYPEYFRTMLVRLYLYGGGPVPAANVRVVSFEERPAAEGAARRFVTGWREFPDPDAARAWIAARSAPAQHRIVSDDPQLSCVALDPLRRYRLVHRSPTAIGQRAGEPIGYVELYEYERRDRAWPPGAW